MLPIGLIMSYRHQSKITPWRNITCRVEVVTNQFKNVSVVWCVSTQESIHSSYYEKRQLFNIDVSHFSRIFPSSTGDEQNGLVYQFFS